MSDGNYNRNLLPYHNYQSGIRAGRATMITKSVKAFCEIIKEKYPEMTDESLSGLLSEFREKLER